MAEQIVWTHSKENKQLANTHYTKPVEEGTQRNPLVKSGLICPQVTSAAHWKNTHILIPITGGGFYLCVILSELTRQEPISWDFCLRGFKTPWDFPVDLINS